MCKKLSQKLAMIVFTLLQTVLVVNITHAADWYPMQTGTEEDLLCVWGSSATDVYAVGENNTIVHFDGIKWSLIENELSSEIDDLKAVWGFSANDVYVGGEGPILLNYNGLSWSKLTWECPEGISCGGNYSFDYIWGESPTDLFIVGWTGITTIWHKFNHYDGEILTPIASPYSEDYADYKFFDVYGLWGSSSTDVYLAAGSYYYGYIYHYDGEVCSLSYKTETENENNCFTDVWGSAADDVFVVGSSGRIYHYDGSTWSPMDSGTQENFFCVWGSSSSDVHAAGGLDTFFHYNGSIWEPMERKPPVNMGRFGSIKDIWVSQDGKGFAVGGSGAVYVYGIPLTTTTTTTSTGDCPSTEMYGEDSEEAELLRELRDNVLAQTPEGREIIKLYYQWSPVIVKTMEEDEEFRACAKEMIDGVLGLVAEGGK